LGRPATLDDIPDSDLDQYVDMGFDWIWLLSVWKTGPASRKVSRENPDWRQEFVLTLPDLTDDDIAGSGFAVTGYQVHPDLGGPEALARLRKRMAKRGLKLMLDFVPNHMGLDHPWIEEHPEYFIAGTEEMLAREPQNYIRVKRSDGECIVAYGRDPYFSGWPDTLQLDYSHPATQEAMMREIETIAGQCDGIRCDMAMLLLPEVFSRTWGKSSDAFWPVAIPRVRSCYPDFCFMAEVYWDLEWTLQQQGFDYTYDKRLYDRLRERHARPVREHLHADLTYQAKLARFLENHDEPRAAATFEPAVHRAAAVITYFIPGLRFFHQGQFEGRKKRISPHIVRAPEEPTDNELANFYRELLNVLKNPTVKKGTWQLLTCQPAWDGNGSCDAFVAHAWHDVGGERIVVVVNYAPHSSQTRLITPFPEIRDHSVRLQEIIGSASYIRDGNQMLDSGLFVDLQPWSYHVFTLELVD